jgi:hypothetical protein
MLYLIIVIFAVIIGLLRGGELERLSHISIDGVHIFIAALLLRGLLWVFEIMDLSIFLKYSSIILIVSYFLLILASFKNITLPGFKYVTLGVLLNSFVITVNGGKMPVLITKQIAQHMNAASLSGQGQNVIYSLKDSKTLFAFLGDVIPLPKPLPETSILSVGDIMIFIGLIILIQKTMIEEDGLQ